MRLVDTHPAGASKTAGALAVVPVSAVPERPAAETRLLGADDMLQARNAVGRAAERAPRAGHSSHQQLLNNVKLFIKFYVKNMIYTLN